MRIGQIELKNFRGFGPKVIIQMDSLVTLIGPNNAGKTTILKALEIFFDSTPSKSSIQVDDFHRKPGPTQEKELEIAIAFNNISEQEAEDFKHYARDDKLKFALRATLKESDGVETRQTVESKIIAIRNGNRKFSSFFEASKAADYKREYDQLRQEGFELPDYTSKEAAEVTLWNYEINNTDQNEEIESKTPPYGVAGPVGRLLKYIDFIYVPAVKEANTETREEKKSQFSSLVERAIKSTLQVQQQINVISADANQKLIELLEAADAKKSKLETEMNRAFSDFSPKNVSVSLQWDSSSAVKADFPILQTKFLEGSNETTISFYGHGTQRAYLMAVLPLMAHYEANNPKQLVLAIEEPELYQHPPQIRYIMNSLQKLSENGAQVLITTHSPYMVSARRFGGIRRILRGDVKSWTIDENRKYWANRVKVEPFNDFAAKGKMDSHLQPRVSEIFFCSKAILVEGIEDVAILRKYLQCIGEWEAFTKAGCEFIDCGGKDSILNVASLCVGFGIEHYFVFDMDTDDKNTHLKINRKFKNWLSVDVNAAQDQFTSDYTAWHKDIQSSLNTHNTRWNLLSVEIANSWKLPHDNIRKNPMLLEEVLERCFSEQINLQPLRDCVNSMKHLWN
jgi:putative ATP-dependent endonuclease of OLD family